MKLVDIEMGQEYPIGPRRRVIDGGDGIYAKVLGFPEDGTVYVSVPRTDWERWTLGPVDVGPRAQRVHLHLETKDLLAVG